MFIDGATHSSKENQKQHFGNHEEHPTDHDREQELTLAHRCGQKTLEQFSDAHLYGYKSDAPKTASHQA